MVSTGLLEVIIYIVYFFVVYILLLNKVEFDFEWVNPLLCSFIEFSIGDSVFNLRQLI